MTVVRTAAVVRRAGRQPGPGDRLPAPGRAGHRRHASPTWRPAGVRGPGQAGHQRDRRVDRRHPGAGRHPRPVPRARVQGHPPGGAARPAAVQHRASSCGPRRACCSSSRGARHWIIGTTDTDWIAGQGPPGRQLAATSTTCSSTSTRCCNSPLTREDVEGVYAGPAAAAVRRVGVHLQAVPRARGRAPGARPGGGRGRQVHHLPGDGRGRGGRGGARRWTPGCPTRCTADLPLVGADGYQALWNQRRSLAASAGIHVARVEHLLNRYGSLHPRAARPDPRRPVAGRAAARRRRLPARSRPATRSPTRAPGTWTTCWPGAPGSRSRPGTAAWPPPRRSPT